MKKRLTFIVNPISGTHGKDGIVRLIPQVIDSEQFDWRVKFTTHAGHASELAAHEVRRGADTVVAVGGDGTVNEVARSLIGSETALGIVPCGSGNGLARHLQLPMDAEGAIRVINEHRVMLADHCRINEHPFFCTCGVGFDAYVSYCFAQVGKRGIWTYAEQMVQISRNYECEEYEVEIDGRRIDTLAFLIACGNASQYGNNVFIAPDASLNDGLMDVVIMEPFKKLVGPQVLYQLMNQTVTRRGDVHLYHAKHVVIRRKTEGVLHFDGEPVVGEPVLDISIVPASIKMLYSDRTLYGGNPLMNVLHEWRGHLGSEWNMNQRRIKNLLSKL